MQPVRVTCVHQYRVHPPGSLKTPTAKLAQICNMPYSICFAYSVCFAGVALCGAGSEVGLQQGESPTKAFGCCGSISALHTQPCTGLLECATCCSSQCAARKIVQQIIPACIHAQCIGLGGKHHTEPQSNTHRSHPPSLQAGRGDVCQLATIAQIKAKLVT